MNFKTVHGLGREEYAIKAVNTAMEKGMPPYHVDQWLKWFDAQPEDNPAALGGFTKDQQCKHCGDRVACADDCPQPEFYVGDLEEVAQAMVKRVEDALQGVVEAMSADDKPYCFPAWMVALFDGVRAEIATPGYVEALLPE